MCVCVCVCVCVRVAPNDNKCVQGIEAQYSKDMQVQSLTSTFSHFAFHSLSLTHTRTHPHPPANAHTPPHSQTCAQHFKAEYKHYCKKEWNAGNSAECACVPFDFLTVRLFLRVCVCSACTSLHACSTRNAPLPLCCCCHGFRVPVFSPFHCLDRGSPYIPWRLYLSSDT